MQKNKLYMLFAMVAILMVCIAPVMATDGQSTSPQKALSNIYSQSTKVHSTNKVVIAVANSDDYGIIALADLVAVHEHAPLLITPRYNLTPMTVEALQQLMAHSGVTEAIVVGVGHNASTIADLVSKITVPNVNLTVSRIIAPDKYDLSLRVAIYEFSKSTTAVITNSNIPEDLALGTMISLHDNIPMIYENAPYDEMNATLQLLGVSTIYTTPAVSAVLQTNLSNAGYTINTSWENKDLTKSIDILLADTQPAKNATIIVNSVPNFIRCASIMGFNTSILMLNKGGSLSVNATNYLTTNKPSLTILIGNYSVISNDVALSVAASTGKKVDRIFYSSPYEEINRLGLLEDAYVYPVIYVYYTHTGHHFTYYFKNIGYSDAVPYGDYALKVTFTKSSGMFTNFSMSPIFQNKTKVIFYFTDPIYPYEYDTLKFSVTTGTNFTAYPELSYNALTLAGAIISIKSYVGLLIEKVSELKSWFINTFEQYFGLIRSHIPLPGLAQTFVAAIIMFLILWTIVGAIAYILKVYVFKSKVTSPKAYGIVGWLLGRGGKL